MKTKTIGHVSSLGGSGAMSDLEADRLTSVDNVMATVTGAMDEYSGSLSVGRDFVH